MLRGLNLANPSRVQQAPDHKALDKTTILVVESQPLSLPPIAQVYLEPGINTKLTRRSKPKTNYTLPSDNVSYKLGFVPVNQTPGANGEEPAIVPQKELIPEDLLKVFQKVESERLASEKPRIKRDVGTAVSRQILDTMRERGEDMKVNDMMSKGFSAEETAKAMDGLREERARQEARKPPSARSVEDALSQLYGKPASSPNGDEPTAP